ncbi:hypothetical protein AAFF_G00056560 [Aldrovandia affinis]|uniref:Uncharacterized protein n=1 Tax=Aldrovandia affinis TaxID=143900 RepID=A0AAD7VXT2_9TELE|nr:hypothetical protein AAFF_G00056560 [Aldrovandia affinis]
MGRFLAQEQRGFLTLVKENSVGGEEVAVLAGLSPELFSSPSGTEAAGPGEGVMSPSMEGAALPLRRTWLPSLRNGG